MSSSEDEKGFDCTICEKVFDSEEKLRNHRKKEHADKVCSECGAEFDSTPFECNYCGESYCSTHRLPEQHDCKGLEGDVADENSEKLTYMSSRGQRTEVSKSKKKESTSDPPSLDIPEISFSLSKLLGKLKGKKKFIPLIALIGLLFVSSYEAPNSFLENGDIQEENVTNKFTQAVELLQSSIVVESSTELLLTGIIIFTIWSIYKYWLKGWKYTRRNSSLLEKIVAVIIFIILVERHVSLSSTLGTYADWALFLMVVYIELAGTWFLAKTIDGIDLSSDLYNWGLRLLGGLTIMLGALMFVSSGLALSLADSSLVFNNIYWIGSVCLMLLGSFMEYRSFRRHPAIKVW